MSHFLSRLVQRTRGDLATLRPVMHAVTGPDPDGVAWDERMIERDAPPLAAPGAGAAEGGHPVPDRRAGGAVPVVPRAIDASTRGEAADEIASRPPADRAVPATDRAAPVPPAVARVDHDPTPIGAPARLDPGPTSTPAIAA